MASRSDASPTIRTTLAGAACGVVLAALPAAAADFVPPQGCEVFMTVQMRSCVVAHHYTCAGDAPGEQWDTLYDSDGPFFTSKVDGEFQWVESYDHGARLRSALEGSRDAASFSTLLSDGTDTYDFTTVTEDGWRRSYRGYDRLTGERVVIDGVELEVTEFALTQTEEDGAVVARRWGNQYIHRDWRLFFGGRETWEDDLGALPSDSSPRLFIFPGEPGFLSTIPLFDCEDLMSRHEAPQMEDIPHDRS